MVKNVNLTINIRVHKVYKPYFFLTFVISPGKENIPGVIHEIREKNMSDTIHHECGFALIRLLKPLDYYQKKTSDLLYKVTMPGIIGFSDMWDNVGEVQNKGFELELQSQNLTGSVRWSTSFNK